MVSSGGLQQLHYCNKYIFHVSVVGTWYLGTTVRPTCVVKSLKPHVLCSGENQSLQNSVSQGASTSHRGENRPETQVSTTIGHSGPHELWGHQANIRPVLPLFYFFPCNPSEGRSLASPANISLFLRSLRGEKSGLSNWSSSIPQLDVTLWEEPTSLSAQEMQPSTHLNKDNLLKSKLYQPSSSNAMSCRRTSNSNHKGWSHKTSKTTS